MPTCKKCNNKFPNCIEENGKRKYLNSRSYCLVCSPRGSNYGYDLRKRATDTKYRDKYKNHNSIECAICKRHFPRRKKNNLVCSTCRGNYLRYKNRKKAIDLLGSQCAKCNINDYDVLTFHHLDSTIKSFDLSESWSRIDFDIIKAEVMKCELLCFNCHCKQHKKNLSRLIDFYERPDCSPTAGDKSLKNSTV